MVKHQRRMLPPLLMRIPVKIVSIIMTFPWSPRENIVEFQFKLQKHMISLMKNVLYVNQDFHNRWQLYQDLRKSTNDEMTQ